MSYPGASSINNGRRYDVSRGGALLSKYHKKSAKIEGLDSRHNTNLNYVHGSGIGIGPSSHVQKSMSTTSTTQNFDSRNESLSSQLASAQSQVIRLEAELSNTNTAKSYAENRLLTLQRDYNSVVQRNAEIVEVMKTLEVGVETLQREKVVLVTERDEFRAKVEAYEKNAAVLSEQVSYLNERNTTLSKKCVDLLDGSKEIREKAAAFEDELKRIKPRYEEMESKFDSLNDQNKSFSTRLNMFEMRERIWIREKTEMEERQKQNVDNWQQIIAEVRSKQEAEIARLKNQLPSVVMHGPAKADLEKIETHSNDLRQLLDSIKRFHSSELERYKNRIEQLEKSAKQTPPLTAQTQLNLKYDESILDDDDDEEIVLLDNGPSSSVLDKKETNKNEEVKVEEVKEIVEK